MDHSAEISLKHFTSKEAAQLLGVNVSTIKRWTDEGKLSCITSLGGHRKFLFQHLLTFIESQKSNSSRVNVYPIENEHDLEISHRIVSRDIAFLRDHFAQLAIDCNRDSLLKVLKGLYLTQVPMHEIYDTLIVPVLHEVGDRWHARLLPTIQEHLASQAIKDAIVRLQGAVPIPAAARGTALCVTLSNELHDIALKMVDHVLELRGIRVLFSGQITLPDDVEDAFVRFHPNRVYLSSTIVSNLIGAQAEFDHYDRLCRKYGSELYVGGRGFDNLRLGDSCRRLSNFLEVATL